MSLVVWILALGIGYGPLGAPTSSPLSQVASSSSRLQLAVSDFRSAHGAAFSPDGERALLGAADRSIRLVDLATGLELMVLKGHTAHIEAIAFSPDGKKALSCAEDGSARLWDLAAGGTSLLLPNEALARVHVVGFCQAGRTAVTGSSDGDVRFYDAATGVLSRKVDAHRDVIEEMAVSASGDQFVTGTKQGVRVWDLSGPAPVVLMDLRLALNSDPLSIALSADGQKALIGCLDGLRVWDARMGSQPPRFYPEFGQVWGVAFTAQGPRAFGSTPKEGGSIWDVEKKVKLASFDDHKDGTTDPHFSPDGKLLLLNHMEDATLWQAQTCRLVRSIRGQTWRAEGISLNSRGDKLVFGTVGERAHVWDLASGTLSLTLSGHTHIINRALFARGDSRIFTASWDKTARLWDAATGKSLAVFEGHTGGLLSAAVSMDGKTAVTGSAVDLSVRIWNLEEHRQVGTLEGNQDGVVSLNFVNDDKQVLCANWDGYLRLYDLAERKSLHVVRADRQMLFATDVLESKNRVYVGGTEGIVRIYTLNSLAPVGEIAVVGKEIPSNRRDITALAVSPDGRRLFVCARSTGAVIIDLESGQIEGRLTLAKGDFESCQFSKDGKRMFTTDSDGAIRIWDAEYRKEMVALYAFDDGTWAAVAPDGRFDCSDTQRTKGLYWVYEDRTKGILEPIEFAQFAPYFHEPGLLRKVISGEALAPIPDLKDVLLYPKIESFAILKNVLSFRLVDQGGGIGQTRVLIDGLEVRVLPARAAHRVDLARELAGRTSPVVSVIAYDAKNRLGSRSVRADMHVQESAAFKKPAKIVAVIAGIEGYATDTLKLNYAEDDAVAMAQTMLACAKGLGVQAKLWLLTNEPNGRALAAESVKVLEPRKANFAKAFTEATAEAGSEQDLFLVYFSGHAIAVGSPPRYLYLTQEARGGTAEYFANESIQVQQAVSSEEMVSWMSARRLRAKKKVIILDTCAASAAQGAVIAMRTDETSQSRAISVFQSRTGMHAILGCPADLFSYEAPAYQHGLLTASLLRAIKTQPLGSEQSPDAIMVDRLFQFARDETPRMAERLGSRQIPTVIGGDSFPLGYLTADVRRSLPTADPAPVFVRPALFNPEEGGDNLKLSDLLASALAELNYAKRGPGSRLPFAVYSDRSQLPDAYKIQGSYTVVGDNIRLRLSIWQNDRRLEPSLELDQVPREGIEARILETVRKWLEAHEKPRLNAGPALP